MVYITDSRVASHKHVLRFHFFTCHFTTAGMLDFFFPLTNTKFLSGLAVNSHLSKPKDLILPFSPHFEELDMRQWGIELRELLSSSDGDLSYNESEWFSAEMNIINIPSLNTASPFVKGKLDS